MAVYDYTDLLARVEEVVYSNESREIKGQLLQQLMIDMVDSQPFLEYDPARTYEEGMACVYNPGAGYKLYVANSQTTGTFIPADWEQVGL